MQENVTALRREALLASEAPLELRRDFIRRTYAHLGVAILAFVGLEYVLIHSSIAPRMLELVFPRGGGFGWLAVLLGFMLVGSTASRWAAHPRSTGMQYLGLAVYVVVEAIIFIPLLFVAENYAQYHGVIGTAAVITGVVFTGLTAAVFLTGADFSWLRQFLHVAMLGALGILIASLLFGFTLGTLYSAAVVLLAAGYILYHTSNIMRTYPVGSHVAASLALFSSVALLFWYILRILMSRR